MVWWKIYFWMFLVLSVIGIFILAEKGVWNLGDWFGVVTSIIAVVGVYAFVFKRPLISSTFWKVFFWLTLIGIAFEVIYAFTPLHESLPIPSWWSGNIGPATNQEFLFALLLILPGVYAVYKLGHEKVSPKSRRTRKK